MFGQILLGKNIVIDDLCGADIEELEMGDG
jgi:hypothetical protein